MRSEALDITIESKSGSVWIHLKGPFHNEQIPNIREKFTVFIDDGTREFVVVLESVSHIGDGVIAMFLDILNTLKGKKGDLKILCRNSQVLKAFTPYQHLFSIYPDIASLNARNLLSVIKRTGQILTRKTGVRLSRPVALFLLVVLCGWFSSLIFTLHIQNRRIQEQQTDLQELRQWKQTALIDISKLQDRIKPLEQLGIINDSLDKE